MAWRSIHRIGGTGGSAFTFLEEHEGRCLQSIMVYRIQACICALTVHLTGADNRVRVFGRTSGHGLFNPVAARAFQFIQGERITELSLWGNGEGTRLGWIYFRTSEGRVFNFGMKRTRQTEYKINVRTGVCLGVVGRHGHEIDQLAFVFLMPNNIFRLNNLSYPLPDNASTIRTTTLQELPRTTTTHNQAAEEVEEEELLYWVFTGSTTVTLRSAWTPQIGQQHGLMAHFSISGVMDPGRIPKVVPSGIAGSSSTFHWDRSAAGGAAASTSITSPDMAWYYASGTIAPGQSVHKRALLGDGTNPAIPFNGVIQSSLGFSFPISGTYTGRTFSDPQVV